MGRHMWSENANLTAIQDHLKEVLENTSWNPKYDQVRKPWRDVRKRRRSDHDLMDNGWERNKYISKCVCGHDFKRTLTSTGKHHCRKCGDIFCSKCAPGPDKGYKRFCLHCLAFFGSEKDE